MITRSTSTAALATIQREIDITRYVLDHINDIRTLKPPKRKYPPTVPIYQTSVLVDYKRSLLTPPIRHPLQEPESPVLYTPEQKWKPFKPNTISPLINPGNYTFGDSLERIGTPNNILELLPPLILPPVVDTLADDDSLFEGAYTDYLEDCWVDLDDMRLSSPSLDYLLDGISEDEFDKLVDI